MAAGPNKFDPIDPRLIYHVDWLTEHMGAAATTFKRIITEGDIHVIAIGRKTKWIWGEDLLRLRKRILDDEPDETPDESED